MPKNDSFYHEQAIFYNRRIEQFALALADEIEHEEVKRWSNAVAKQHRYHLKRHERSLERIRQSEEEAMSENEKPDVDYRDAGTGQYVTEEYAHDNPTTTVSETRELDAAPIEEVGPDPEAAAAPVEAGVGTAPELTPEEAQAAFEKAQRDAEEAAQNG